MAIKRLNGLRCGLKCGLIGAAVVGGMGSAAVPHAEASEPKIIRRQILSSSLLSPVMTEEYADEEYSATEAGGDESIRVSQAAPEHVASRLEAVASRVQSGWLGSMGPEFRPYLGMEWFGVEEARIRSNPNPRARAGWMGVRLQGDAALLRWSIGELGVGASAYQSAFAITSDARPGSATNLKGQVHLLLKANTTSMGSPMLKLIWGYQSNRRSIPSATHLISTVNGPRAGVELSTYVDRVFTIGATTSYTFSQAGVFEVGGFVSHRLFNFTSNAWDARFGVTTASAREQSSFGRLDENWTSLQFGLVGSI